MMAFLAQRWLPIGIDASVKSLIVLLLAALGTALLRRASAAYRHLLWRMALGSLLLLPALSLALPHWQIALALPASAPPMVLTSPRRLSAPAVIRIDRPISSRFAPNEQAPQEEHAPVWIPVVFLAWLLGMGFVLLRTGHMQIRVRRLARQCLPLPEGALAEIVRQCTPPRLGRRRPLVKMPDRPGIGPMTWGWARPVILLPMEAIAWPEAQVRAVVLHEMAHVERGDWLAQLLGQILCALYWFDPLVWWATRRLRLESEQACDDRVLETGMKASDYAQHLLAVTRTVNANTIVPTVAVTMGQLSGMEERMRAILASKRNRQAPNRRGWLALLGLTAALILPIASLRPTSAQSATSSPSQGVKRHSGKTAPADTSFPKVVLWNEGWIDKNGRLITEETIPLRFLDVKRVATTLPIPPGIERLTLDFRDNSVTVNGDQEAIQAFKREVHSADIEAMAYRLEMRLVRYHVDTQGRRAGETVVMAPRVMTLDKCQASISTREGESGIAILITPSHETGNTVRLSVEVQELGEQGEVVRSGKNERSVPLGEATRITGMADSSDKALRRAVQKGDIVTDRGEYTGYYLEVKPTMDRSPAK